jgi:hypothetical protein
MSSERFDYLSTERVRTKRSQFTARSAATEGWQHGFVVPEVPYVPQGKEDDIKLIDLGGGKSHATIIL